MRMGLRVLHSMNQSRAIRPLAVLNFHTFAKTKSQEVECGVRIMIRVRVRVSVFVRIRVGVELQVQVRMRVSDRVSVWVANEI